MRNPTFTDAHGREWAIHDYSVIAGKVLHFPVDAVGAAYRGFAPTDGGARRTYLFKLADDRTPAQGLLEQQLAASSLYFKDDPAVCEVNRQVGFSRGLTPERVDAPMSTNNREHAANE